MPNLDLVVLTILPEEYHAVCKLIPNLQPASGSSSSPNLYAWQTGSVECNNKTSSYQIAVGMLGRAGTTKSALAAIEAIERWHPRYLFFVGIAGGFGDLNKGDVVIADVIYGYEYGKIKKIFDLRHNWTYNTDTGLLNGATAYSIQNKWQGLISGEPPKLCTPKVVTGEVASGDKVVDDPSNKFFVRVLKELPKIKAVEMEGAGAGEAVEQAHAKGYSLGFMMIRGISDLPRPPKSEAAITAEQGTQERDNWKPYASATAGAFLVGWLKSGLPIMPSRSEIIDVNVQSVVNGAPSQNQQWSMNNYENAVFVSYAWGGESERTVDALERAFNERGIRILRDKKDLGYKGSIEAFEQRIGQCQCIVLVISDKYLRSEHCMYELVKTAEHQRLRERIFPIVLADADIYKAVNRLVYIKHWDEKIAQLNQAIRDVGMMTNITNITADLNNYARIRANIDHLIDLLSDMNTLTPEIHAATGFSTLISALERAMNLKPPTSQSDKTSPSVIDAIKNSSSNSQIANPFTPLTGMIDLEKFFYGRKQELALIFEYLNSGASVALIGDKAVGKSSILHAICRHADRMLNTIRKGIYLNLENIANDKEFFASLCYWADIKECSGFALNRALRDHKLLLAIDEVEKMTWKGFSREIRSQLRGLAQDGYEPPIRLVMAASTPLDHLFPDSHEAGMTSPLANICTQVDIGNWDEPTTSSFISNRLSNTAVEFTPDEINSVFEQSHGHPQKVMQVSYHLFSKKSNNKEGF